MKGLWSSNKHLFDFGQSRRINYRLEALIIDRRRKCFLFFLFSLHSQVSAEKGRGGEGRGGSGTGMSLTIRVHFSLARFESAKTFFFFSRRVFSRTEPEMNFRLWKAQVTDSNEYRFFVHLRSSWLFNSKKIISFVLRVSRKINE